MPAQCPALAAPQWRHAAHASLPRILPARLRACACACRPERARRRGRSVTVAVAAAAAPLAVPPEQLLVAAALPVAKVALMCGVGAWAARQGHLTPAGRRLLSGLTLHVFTPAMMAAKLGAGVGVAEVAHAWHVTANMVLNHAVGLALGAAAVRVAAVPSRLAPHVVLACGLGNVGNLPFVLLAGMAADPALPFAGALGGGAAAVELAMRYVALSNFSATLMQFPLALLGLRPAAPASHSGPAPAAGGLEAAAPPLPPAVQPSPLAQPSAPPAASTPAAASASPGAASASTPAAASAPVPAPAPASAAAPPAAGSASAPGWRELAAGLLSPPTVASLVAVAVASWPPAQAALFSPSGSLRVAGEVVEALGAACIPLLLMVLGANLAGGPGVAAGRLPGRAVAAALAARLLLLPAVCGGLLLAAWHAGLLPGADPLALLVMLVMHGTPTAVLVHSIASLYGNAEDEVAALLFWQYAAALLTLPALIAGALAVLGPAAGRPEAWAGMGAGRAMGGAAAVAAAAVG